MSASNSRGAGRVLVVGGAGYIGSHMTRLLLREGYETAVFDNLSTGHREFVPANAEFLAGDLRSRADLRRALDGRHFDTVMHFAASSIVPESVREPLAYYENNISGTARLLEAMRKYGFGRLVFSSTAAVYGEPVRVPISEDDPKLPTNPYGRTKLAVERMLEDSRAAYGIRYIALRYFNACGADEEGGIGESHEPETHLIPNILRAALEGGEVTLFGSDYDTPDGTCVRDYVHVTDICRAHLSAAGLLARGSEGGAYNLGSGSGYSVRQVLEAAEAATGRTIASRVADRRPGDPAKLVASREKAGQELDWRPEIGLDRILKSAWEWERARRGAAVIAGA